MTAKANRPRSTKKAAIARQNGKRGGRPRSRLPQELLDKLGPPPAGALQRAEWAARLLAEVGWMQFHGKVDAGLAASVRAFCGTIHRTQDASVAAELERLLKAQERDVAADDAGPQPEPVAGGEALRGPAPRS